MSDQNTTVALPRLPRLPKAKKVADHPCECGCGQLVVRRFKPGHDSRLKGWTLRVERGLMTLDEIFELTGGTGEAAATAKALGIEWTAGQAEEKSA